MSLNYTVCDCPCGCSMPCPYVDVCTCTKGLEKSYVDVPMEVERKDAKRTWSSLFGIDCKETSLFSYAIENKNLIYILMFCAFLHQFRKSTIDVFKLAGHRTKINQTDHAAVLQHEKTFVWCCRAQPWMAQAMLILKVWRKIGREICPETLASKLNYLNSSKLYQF